MSAMQSKARQLHQRMIDERQAAEDERYIVAADRLIREKSDGAYPAEFVAHIQSVRDARQARLDAYRTGGPAMKTYAMVVIVSAPDAESAWDETTERNKEAEFVGSPWEIATRDDMDYDTWAAIGQQQRLHGIEQRAKLA